MTTPAFIVAIEETLKVAWGDLEAIAEDTFSTLKAAVCGIAGKLLPEQWTILSGLIAKAQADVSNGDYADLVTDVLNQAEAEELAWLHELTSDVLTAAIAALHQGGVQPGSANG